MQALHDAAMSLFAAGDGATDSSSSGGVVGFSSSSTGGSSPVTTAVVNESEHIWLYFTSLLIIMLVHRSVGTLFHKVGIPRIIGDIVAGCLLGPTIMGTEANNWLFPSENRPILAMFGQFGLIMTSMSAGFSFDRRVMRGRVAKVSAYTFLNNAVPALVSIPLFFILPNNTNWRGESFDSAAYFVLVVCAMSSSALPMVFLILSELKLNNDTSRFAIGLSCLSTICLFTLLSIVAVLSDPTMAKTIILIRLLLLGLVFAVLLGLQWLWGHFLSRATKDSYGFLRYGSDDMAIIVISMGLGVAVCSERLGFTFLLGAFLAGAAMPFDLGLRSNLGEKIRWMTRWVFLPQFFLSAGLRFDLRKLRPESIPFVLLFLFMAFAAKAALIPISHYVLKMSWRDSAFCASLANCRGFNALIVAQIGAQYGLIGQSFFITCVLLSILSTGATGPLARLFRPEDDAPINSRTAFAHTSTAHLSAGSMASSNPSALSPRLLDAYGQPASASLDGVDAAAGGAANGPESVALDSVRIVLPADSAAFPDDTPPSGHALPEDREAFFSSWLSEGYSSKSRVLVLIGEDVRGRLRVVSPADLPVDRSSGEARFRGDLFVDWLSLAYGIHNRSVAVTAGQKLLEAGVIAPVHVPVFTDKPHLWTIG